MNIKLERRKTQLFSKIEKLSNDLYDSILNLSDLQDEFTLIYPAIEELDEWSANAMYKVGDLNEMIYDLEGWLFDGDTVVEHFEDAELHDAPMESLMAMLEELVTEMYQKMDDDSLQSHHDVIFGED